MTRRFALILGAVPFIVVALYRAGLFVAHDGAVDFRAIDACLDSGGHWDYRARTCKGR